MYACALQGENTGLLVLLQANIQCKRQQITTSDMNRLVLEEKVKIVRLFSKCENARGVQRQLYQFGVAEGKWGEIGVKRAPVPSTQTILSINEHFNKTGRVDQLLSQPGPSKRVKTVVTPENMRRVREEILRSPDKPKSHRRLSSSLGISPSSIYAILKELKMKPYIPRLHHKLNDDDPDRRMQFCEFWNEKLTNDPNFTEKVVWSDEAKFHIDGVVNRHNCRYWRTECPNIVLEKTVKSPGVLVWCGLWYGGIIGPIFFDGTVNGTNYLALIDNTVIPFMEEHQDMLFMQDGAPPHYAAIVRNQLDAKMPRRWIGRRGPIEWPARSPDLTPLDFFFWGYLKDKVYANRVRDINHLKLIIEEEINKVRQDDELIMRVCNSVSLRIEECIDANGGHFEN